MKRLFLFLILLCAARASAQVPVTFSPYQRQQFSDNNGNPLAGGKLCTYQAGTSTPLATYTDYTGLFQNTNPIILDSGGFANVWITANAYRFILLSAGTDNTCSTGVQQWVLDFITPPLSAGGNNVFTGNNTFSGTTNFSGPVNLNAGGSLNGSFSGTPNFVGNVIFSGNPLFTGSPNFTTATIVWPTAIQSNLNVPTQSVVLPNETITGTTSSSLAKLTGSPSTVIITSTTDVGGVIGICTSNCFAAGNATIQTNGTTTCNFDGNTAAGDYVQISTMTNGKCHDVGGGGYPSSGQVIGRVLSTNVGAGQYLMELFPPDIRAPSVSINYPNVVYSTPSASTNANITPAAGTMITPGVTATYRFNWYVSLTVIGTSCTGSTTIGVRLTYQDPSAPGTTPVILSNTNINDGTSTLAGFTLARLGNGTLGVAYSQTSGFGYLPSFEFRAKAGTPIQYDVSYGIGAACAPGPQYQLFPILEQMTSN